MGKFESLELELRPLIRAALTTTLLCVAIAAGSRSGRWLDPALMGYLLASIFACFGVSYRYWAWVERPATAMYLRHSAKLLASPKALLLLPKFFLLALDQMFFQRFIERRSIKRWGAHALIAWGCLLAFAVTFPLVFGWIRFTNEGLNPNRYQTWLFGFPMGSFPLQSPLAFITFHILDFAAVMVIAGCLLAFIRRRQDEGDLATQRFDLDIMPLLTLIAVSVTGLMLTASESYLQGRNFGTLAYLHELTVILLLLSLPFGKLFHIIQRPAQLGVSFYKAEGESEGRETCKACGVAFIRKNQRRDLESLWKELDLDGARHENQFHHLDLCPKCKRRLIAKSQGVRLGMTFDGSHEETTATEPIPDLVTFRS
jgi:hypothetical protein